MNRNFNNSTLKVGKSGPNINYSGIRPVGSDLVSPYGNSKPAPLIDSTTLTSFAQSSQSMLGKVLHLSNKNSNSQMQQAKIHKNKFILTKMINSTIKQEAKEEAWDAYLNHDL
jgi:hypothetical protein